MALAALAMLTAGCSGGTVINTDESPTAAPASTSAAPLPPPSNAHLANAFDYVAYPPGGTSYYFTSPSGTLGVRDHAAREGGLSVRDELALGNGHRRRTGLGDRRRR